MLPEPINFKPHTFASRIYNTINSHRLVEWTSKEYDRETSV